MKTVRVMTKRIVQRLNTAAIKRRENRTLVPSMVNLLSEEQVFPVTQALLTGGDNVMRCRIIFNERGTGAELDIPVDDFNKLPTVNIPEE
jgi:hypothetical protein